MGIFQRSIYSVSFEDMSIISYFSYLQIFLHGLVWGWTMGDFLETLVDSLCKVHDLLSCIECTQCRHENICLSIWWIYIQSGTPCNMSIGQDDIEAPRSLCIEILHNSYVRCMDTLMNSEYDWCSFLSTRIWYRTKIREKSQSIVSCTAICPFFCMCSTLYHERLRSWMYPFMIGNKCLSWHMGHDASDNIVDIQ